MDAPTNPFDVLPDELFNLLGTQGGLQHHYIAILLRIYSMAEFNRFGLTREMVIDEIEDYLSSDAAEGIEALTDGAVDQEPLSPEDPEEEEAAASSVDETHHYAGWILRRLVDAGWLEREQQADYAEFIILPDYAFTLLEAFRTIQEQRPREYTGQLYVAHQLLTNESDDFSPALALTQAYENVRQVVRGLNELNQNIRRYTERVTRDRPVAELLRLQYEDYAHALGPTYHALKTSDHVSRYRRDILMRLQTWQLDGDWLDNAAAELATQSRLTPAQAANEIGHYLRFIINQLESLDPLLGEIDRRHAQYLRTSLRQIRYQLVGADGGFKDRLALLARRIALLQADGEEWLPDGMPTFYATPVSHPDVDSFYTMPRRRAPFQPDPVVAPTLDPSDVRALRAVTLRELGQAITPDRVQRFVGQFLNGNRSIHIRDLPAGTFEDEEDLPWLIYTIAYADHPEVNYDIDPLPGDPISLGPVRVRPFRLLKRGP